MNEKQIRELADEIMKANAKNWKYWDVVCKEEVLKSMVQLYKEIIKAK